MNLIVAKGRDLIENEYFIAHISEKSLKTGIVEKKLHAKFVPELFVKQKNDCFTVEKKDS